MAFLNGEEWNVFLAIKKDRCVSWYGTGALLRDPLENCFILNRSYDAGNKIHAQILILREVLVRLKELEIKSIALFDDKNTWKNLINNKDTIHWEIYPAFSDIHFLTNHMQVIHFNNSWHPLTKETQKQATKAATARISNSWP